MKKIALVQMTSTADFAANLKQAILYLEQAVDERADLVAYPENFLLLGNKSLYQKSAQSIPGPTVQIFQQLAKKNQISILMGSIYEKVPDNSNKIYNTSIMIDRQGEIVATYRKIHLFDINLPEVVINESELVAAGNKTVVCEHELGCIGFSICYDIRFPNLYQRLTDAGANLIFVPSAFTVPTGNDHWMALLKARAIENQVYLAAPAQFGKHGSDRESYGKTTLINPWGDVLTTADDKPGIVYGEIDLALLRQIRQRMPIMNHKIKGIDH